MQAANRWWVVCAVCALTACRDPTQVTLDVTTDVRCDDVPETEISVGRLDNLESRVPTASTERCGPNGEIGSLVVVPSGSKDEELAIRVVTGLEKTAESCVADGYQGGCIVARRALRFLPHTPLVLPVAMRIACRDIPCEDFETCVNGRCVPATIEDPTQCKTPRGCAFEDSTGLDGGLVAPAAEDAYLKASNVDADDWFGRAVAVSGDRLVSGALWEDSDTTGIGGPVPATRAVRPRIARKSDDHEVVPSPRSEHSLSDDRVAAREGPSLGRGRRPKRMLLAA